MKEDVIIIGRREFDVALNSGMVLEDLIKLKKILIRRAFNNFNNKCQRTCRNQRVKIKRMQLKKSEE